MRVWFNYILIFFVSIFCCATVVSGKPAKSVLSAKLEIVRTANVIEHNASQHCAQLDDSEVLTATYSQYNAFGPALPSLYQESRAVIYPNVYAPFTHGQNNVPIQPFYKLLLFPFHCFW